MNGHDGESSVRKYLPRIVYYQPVLPRASLPPSIQADLDLVRTAEIKSDSDPKFIREIKSKAENNLKGAQQKSQQKSQQKLNDHVNTWAEDFQFVERDKHRDNEKDRRIREKVLFDELQMLLQLNEKTNKIIILEDATSKIQQETLLEQQLSTVKSELMSKIYQQLDQIRKICTLKEEKTLSCLCHLSYKGQSLGTALGKRKREGSKEKDLSFLLKLLRNICYKCYYVKDLPHYVVGAVSHQPQFNTLGSHHSLPLQLQPLPVVLNSKISSPPPETSESNVHRSPRTQNQTITGDSTSVILTNSDHLNAPTNALLNDPASLYPVINVDEALNRSDSDSDDEADEERQKFKKILFFDRAEFGINIDDIF